MNELTIQQVLAGDNACTRLLQAFEAKYGKVTVRKKAWWCPTPGRFVTTLWGTIHWPDSRTVRHPKEALPTLAHELQHVVQFRRHPILFPLSYLFPQLLAPLALLGLLWWPLWMIALAALPWPAYWRARAEANCYALSLRVWRRLGKRLNAEVYHEAFVGWAYYRMWPFWSQVEGWLEDASHCEVTKLVNEVL